MKTPFQTLYWQDEKLFLLDQRLLPGEEKYFVCATVAELAEAIRTMVVRGAPAIGIAAAYGVVLGLHELKGKNIAEGPKLLAVMEEPIRILGATRPTAVNLFWALERMRLALKGFVEGQRFSPEEVRAKMLAEALTIHQADVENNRRMGRFGQTLLPANARVLTHCNAGALATGGFGTALGVIYAAHEMGKNPHVFVDETRPFLQGARLTAWELAKHHVPLTLICDNMAGVMLRDAGIDCVVVGADRIARNGDVANKIGTYSVAVLAKAHAIPFYVAAPTSTFDFKAATGKEIPIEERASTEVTQFRGMAVAPAGVQVKNPSFDVTPNELITAIICEKGILRPPFLPSIKEIMDLEC